MWFKSFLKTSLVFAMSMLPFFASSEENYFLNRIETFRQDVDTQVNKVFIPQVKLQRTLTAAEAKYLIEMATQFNQALDKKIVQYKNDYGSEFIKMEKDDAAKVRLLDAESDIKWAVEKSLNAMVTILNTLENEQKLKTVSKEMAMIADITQRLESNQRMTPTMGDLVKGIAPVKKGLFRTLCSAITRMCINQDISKIINELPTSSFSRGPQKSADIEVISDDGQVSKELFKLPKNAAVIFAMNHDHAILDLKNINILAQKLGVDRNMVLTTTDAWPQAKIYKNNDPNIMFIQEKGIAQKVIQNMKDHKGEHIAFTIYPEGQLPFWGTQFPLYAKFGAFIIARKAAIALKEQRPVYYIEVHSNFLKNITSKDLVNLKLQVYEPKLVPDVPLAERDEWAEKTRAKFEERANSPEKRGHQYDLIERGQTPGTRLKQISEVRPYMLAPLCSEVFAP